MPSFLQIYQTADDQAHDAAAEDPFPAYLEGVDTSLAPFCPTSATRVLKALRMGRVADQVFGGEHSDHGVRFEQGDLLSTLKSANTCSGGGGGGGDGNQKVDVLPWTVIVLFLLPDHSDRFADDILQLHQRGARIISLVFNLDEIKGLTLQQADEQDGIFIYGKSPLV
ncbi:unnamed protein product [Absidia cylindrospora]